MCANGGTCWCSSDEDGTGRCSDGDKDGEWHEDASQQCNGKSWYDDIKSDCDSEDYDFCDDEDALVTDMAGKGSKDEHSHRDMYNGQSHGDW